MIPTPDPATLTPAAVAGLELMMRYGGGGGGGGDGDGDGDDGGAAAAAAAAATGPMKRPPQVLAGGYKLRLFAARRLPEADALPVDAVRVLLLLRPLCPPADDAQQLTTSAALALID